MSALAAIAAALLAAAPQPQAGAKDGTAPPRDPDAEVIENLELLERMELLQHLDVLSPPAPVKAPEEPPTEPAPEPTPRAPAKTSPPAPPDPSTAR